MMHAAKHAGKELLKYFGKRIDFEEKTQPSDICTDADISSERIIMSNLESSFPKYNILSEEAGLIDHKSDFTFIIDPLDGSNNFLLGIPNFSVSIGLMHKDTVISGVVYVPILQQLYSAQKGKGAYLNKKRLHVNKVTRIQQATISCTHGYNADKDFIFHINRKLTQLAIKRYLTNWSPATEYSFLVKQVP
jgi:myo-inositol-1(or 4)-monophosphatase